MLRVFVLVAATLFFTAAVAGVAVDPLAWPTLIVATLILVGTVFKRSRYGALQSAPTTPEWRETTERFIDDASGRPVTVWVEPGTGARRYVATDERTSA